MAININSINSINFVPVCVNGEPRINIDSDITASVTTTADGQTVQDTVFYLVSRTNPSNDVNNDFQNATIVAQENLGTRNGNGILVELGNNISLSFYENSVDILSQICSGVQMALYIEGRQFNSSGQVIARYHYNVSIQYDGLAPLASANYICSSESFNNTFAVVNIGLEAPKTFEPLDYELIRGSNPYVNIQNNPNADAINIDSLVLNNQVDLEYSLDSGTTWQTYTTFTSQSANSGNITTCSNGTSDYSLDVQNTIQINDKCKLVEVSCDDQIWYRYRGYYFEDDLDCFPVRGEVFTQPIKADLNLLGAIDPTGAGSIDANYDISFTISWDRINEWNEGFRIYRDGILLETIAPTASGYVDNDPTLQPNTDYTYDIVSFDNNTFAGGCETSTSVTVRYDIVLQAPFLTSAILDGSDPSFVTLNWTDSNPNENVIEIFRSTLPSSNFVKVGEVVGGVLTYDDNNSLVNGETYYYKVRAGIVGEFNTDIYSPFSNTLSVEYFEIFPPINLEVVDVSFECVDLIWEEQIDGTVSGYTYYIQALQGANSWITLQAVEIGESGTTVCGLSPDTDYTIRIIAKKDGQPNSFIWSGEIVNFTTLALPTPFSELDEPFTVQQGTCGNNNCSITITDYDIYSDLYQFTLTDFDGNEYIINEATGVYENLQSGYYFLDVIPITPFLRDTYQARWIAATNVDGNYDITESIVNHTVYSIKTVGQKWNSSATLSAELTGNWIVYRANPTIVGTANGVDSITVTNLKPNYRYYYSFEPNILTDCKTLGSFYIECIDDFTLGGVKKVFVAPYTGDTAIIVDDKVLEVDDTLQWYEIPTHPSTTFTEAYNRDRAGVFYGDILTLPVANDGIVDWTDVEFLLDKTWIVVFQDNNDNYWVFGHDNGAQSDIVSKNTGNDTESNAFTIGFSNPQSDGVLMTMDKTFVINNIL